MMYNAFYKRGGHASVMEEIKMNEIVFFNTFLNKLIQHVSLQNSGLFIHRIKCFPRC